MVSSEMLRGLGRVGVLLALAYVVLVGALFLFQSRLVFLPDVGGRALVATPDSIGLAFDEIALATPDGETLHGWWLPHPQAGPVVLFHHGNAGNISHRLQSLRLLHEMGASVLIFDYRGFGQSTGRPSEAGLLIDARTAYQWLIDDQQLSPDSIVLFGRSLGAAVAAHLATEVEACALVLESSFSSLDAVARHHYPWLPVRWLLRLHFPVDQWLADTLLPTLIIHSREDEIIPFSHAERLLERAQGDGRLLEIQGDHNHGFLQSGQQYRQGLGEFLAACQ